MTSHDQGFPGTMVLFHPFDDEDNFKEEERFREQCCNIAGADMYCNNYFERRLTDNCGQYLPTVQGELVIKLMLKTGVNCNVIK